MGFIDLPPKPEIWLPPRPAIIRSAKEFERYEASLGTLLCAARRRATGGGGVASSLGDANINANQPSLNGQMFRVRTAVTDGAFSSFTIRMSGGVGGTEDTTIGTMHAGIFDPTKTDPWDAVSMIAVKVAAATSFTITQDVKNDKTSDTVSLSGVTGDRIIICGSLTAGAADHVGRGTAAAVSDWDTWVKVGSLTSTPDDSGWGTTEGMGSGQSVVVEGIDFA